MKEQVINLGKKLVQELGLEPGVDTLSRWMAHYIAEQITIAENSTGHQKIKAEEKCVQTILNIWERRSQLPGGRRPFENFEPIFQTLERLNPDKPRPFYYVNPSIRQSAEEDASKPTNEVQKWLNSALGVDSAARVLIEFAFSQAAMHAKDKKTKSWVEQSANLQGVEEIRLIFRLAEYKNDQDEKARELLLEEQKNYFRSRIEKLDTFLKLCKSLRIALANEFKKLPTKSASSDKRNISKRKSRSKK
jgi:hypothetical protein